MYHNKNLQLLREVFAEWWTEKEFNPEGLKQMALTQWRQNRVANLRYHEQLAHLMADILFLWQYLVDSQAAGPGSDLDEPEGLPLLDLAEAASIYNDEDPGLALLLLQHGIEFE